MSFSSDGASVMMGKNGVAKKLSYQNPCLIVTHCIAHHLSLACKEAEKKVPFSNKVKVIMKDAYLFSKIHHTVKNLCLSIEPLLDCIIEVASETSPSKCDSMLDLYENLCEWKVLAFLFFLYDILGHLKELSKFFQLGFIKFSDIDPMIKSI
ncbi:9644_t:CDS:2, partial [Entrophospora sp. SA101]